jgi:hypothetical protein
MDHFKLGDSWLAGFNFGKTFIRCLYRSRGNLSHNRIIPYVGLFRRNWSNS